MYCFLCITSAENFHLSFSNSSTEISHLCSLLYRPTSCIKETWSSQREKIIILIEWKVLVGFCFTLDEIPAFINIWEHFLKEIYNIIGRVGLILKKLRELEYLQWNGKMCISQTWFYQSSIYTTSTCWRRTTAVKSERVMRKQEVDGFIKTYPTCSSHFLLITAISAPTMLPRK